MDPGRAEAAGFSLSHFQAAKACSHLWAFTARPVLSLGSHRLWVWLVRGPLTLQHTPFCALSHPGRLHGNFLLLEFSHARKHQTHLLIKEPRGIKINIHFAFIRRSQTARPEAFSCDEDMPYVRNSIPPLITLSVREIDGMFLAPLFSEIGAQDGRYYIRMTMLCHSG